MNQTKEELIKEINSTENKVIALTGKWGIGKTFLWSETKNEVKDYIEISAFGIKNIDEIKNKIFEDLIKKIDKTSLSKAVSSATKDIAKKFLGINLGDIAKITLPELIRGKIIVIDDIERKNKSLEINDILGFINEYIKKNESRFLLILNKNSLEEKKIWEILHEKIIDKEIILNPSVEKNFLIAKKDVNKKIADSAKEFFIRNDIKNIRVIKKSLKFTQEILDTQDDIPQPILNLYAPKLAFIATCHFHGFDNELNLEFLTNHIFNTSKNKENTELEKIISAEGIMREKITEIAIDYLRFGKVEKKELKNQLKKLKKNTEEIEKEKLIEDFISKLNWDKSINEEEILEFIEEVTKNPQPLNYIQVRNINRSLEENKYQIESETLIDKWVATAKNKPDLYNELSYFQDNELPEKIRNIRNQLPIPEEKKIELKETIKKLITRKELSQKEINTLTNSKNQEYEKIILNLDKEDLRKFIQFYFYHVEKYNKTHWENSKKEFIEACEKIIKEKEESRIKEIIKREIKKMKQQKNQ